MPIISAYSGPVGSTQPKHTFGSKDVNTAIYSKFRLLYPNFTVEVFPDAVFAGPAMPIVGIVVSRSTWTRFNDSLA